MACLLALRPRVDPAILAGVPGEESMGLLDRVFRVIRANLTAVVSGAEDPERLLEQTVADMQSDLIAIRQAVAQAIATQKRTERQQAQAETTAQEWYNRAQLALNKGDETNARAALERRQPYLETARVMADQQQQQRQIVQQMKANMRQLEAKLAEARTKKDMFIARSRSAQASQRLNEMMGQMDGSFGTFNRLEDKIAALEAQSAAISEVNDLSGNKPLERRFAELEQGNVEADLAALKAQLGERRSPQLPPLDPSP
ncbi:MAG: PspA/IM30 family protein [Cyanobacteria bacterium P01_A01_bin.105]